jgi:hypothetical protein
VQQQLEPQLEPNQHQQQPEDNDNMDFNDEMDVNDKMDNNAYRWPSDDEASHNGTPHQRTQQRPEHQEPQQKPTKESNQHQQHGAQSIYMDDTNYGWLSDSNNDAPDDKTSANGTPHQRTQQRQKQQKQPEYQEPQQEPL